MLSLLQPTYSLPLVFAALCIATLASYTTLDLAGRISALGKSAQRRWWLAGGAMSMGLGIWCMHFVGMLSFSLPIPLGYHVGITAVSLVIAVLVSYFALDLVTRGRLSAARLGISGTLLGIGIAGMHYTGMAAMQMSPGIRYKPLIFTLSILIAIVAATAALWIASTLRSNKIRRVFLWRMGAALIMGCAIVGMHYTGMAAAEFPLGSVCLAASGISANWLAVTIAGSTFSILTITLVLSVLDARLQVKTTAYVQSLKSVNEKLQHQATHDALTGLPNRILLFERIQLAIDSAERTQNQFALYFIDLDGFKAINDSLGHAAGDGVLKELASRLKNVVRREDIVARLGGDEFVVMVGNIPDAGMASHIAEKLFECFKTQLIPDQANLPVSPSIGIALFPDDGTTVDELINHADAAMYEVKASGRNNYRFFEASMNVAMKRTIEIQRSLAAAIGRGEFFLQYQPKFDCADDRLLGAEALLRWQHGTLGLLSPAEFIPIAERTGQIIALGKWVIDEVCRQMHAWRRAGLKPLKVAINLSQIQLRSPGIVEDILETAGIHGISPSLLMFEITETVAMQDAEATMSAIRQLQEAGFELAIDDFGTGYSSLSYLQQFGVQQMKVDRSFINNLTTDEKGQAIVAAIIRLAHSLNMEVVAEGVETEAQLALLKVLKCDQTQGYLLGRPMDVSELGTLMVDVAQVR
ncbi:putative bifunctional diguanylate cyclase/phosphodiesterase [Noviherbaspirillum aerium]|uniref:putative bifunctional diguanylate cyclase/phosphodiesterase n=1 Tax=Noviherbaspirillum aerium TaxID=2588497 RepID=UPI00124F456F|nr:EAL domain-containing protein [Noviherbaspirillum aerium]